METSKICKHNMKLYPIYRTLSFDFLFFYTINILFLTQIKHINVSDILLIDSFYSLFGIVFQIPASIILEKTNRKKSMILGNLLNCIYLILIIYSKNIIHLILAEMICAFGFALKDISSPSLLNESIPTTKRRSEIFAKLNGKAMSGYYILNAISLIISGILYNINGYIPLILSLIITLISFLLSTCFIEPLENVNKTNSIKEDINLKESFKFILSSGRLKSLILFSSIMTALIYILASTEIYLIEELHLSSSIIGIIFAVLCIISGIAAKKQDIFHKTFKSKSLTVLGLAISISCITSTLGFFFNFPSVITLLIVLISFTIKYITTGLFNVLIVKYLSNFANGKIDSKIYTIQILSNSIFSAILGSLGSIVVNYLNAYKSMLAFGIIFLILFTISIIYMKNKLGLQPHEYPNNEIKYSKV